MCDLTPSKFQQEAPSVNDEVHASSTQNKPVAEDTPTKMQKAVRERKRRKAKAEALKQSERSRDSKRYANLSFQQRQRKVERNRKVRQLTREKETWIEQAGRLSEHEQRQIMQLRSASDQWDEILDLSETSISRQSGSNQNAYTGFRNLGNTCYLNVIFQALIHCLPFREAILQMQSEPGTLARSLQTLMHQCLSEQWAILMPLATVTSFFEVAPEFHDGCQHDAAEAFGMLFGTVPELQLPCRSLALAAQDGVILVTVPPAIVRPQEVSWPKLIAEALKGDAQPRALPKVLVVAFSNSRKRSISCNAK